MNLRHHKPLHAYKFPVYNKGLYKKSKKIKQQPKNLAIITQKIQEKIQEKRIQQKSEAQKITERHVKRHAKMLVHFIQRVNLSKSSNILVYQQNLIKQETQKKIKYKKKNKKQGGQAFHLKYKKKTKNKNQKTKLIIKNTKNSKNSKNSKNVKKAKIIKQKKIKAVKIPKQRKNKSKIQKICFNKQNIDAKTEEFNFLPLNKGDAKIQQADNELNILESLRNNQQIKKCVKEDQQNLVLHYDCQKVQPKRLISQINQNNQTFIHYKNQAFLNQNNQTFTFESKDYENYLLQSDQQYQDEFGLHKKEQNSEQLEESFSSIQLSLSL